MTGPAKEHAGLEAALVRTKDPSPEGLWETLQRARPRLRKIAEQELPQSSRSRLGPSDVVQETGLRAFGSIKQFQGGDGRGLVAWFRQVSRNQIVDAVRHHSASRRDIRGASMVANELLSETSPSPSWLLRRLETLAALARARKRLPDRYAEVIRLRQEEDLSFEEIGARMECSGDAARMLWGRAVVRLARLMNADAS